MNSLVVVVVVVVVVLFLFKVSELGNTNDIINDDIRCQVYIYTYSLMCAHML
jgi:hypothetical protein